MNSNELVNRLQNLLEQLSQYPPNNSEDSFDASELKTILSRMSAWIRPTWEPETVFSSASEVNRKGSSIGGYPYTTRRFPWPTTDDGLPLAPLAQLDLDEIRDATGNDYGRGLLQAWLPNRSPGDEFQLLIRQIPRSVADSTDSLTDKPPDPEADIEMRKTGFGFETHKHLKMSNITHEEYLFHRNWASVGFDWTLTRIDISEWTPPMQITDWRADGGYSLPDWDDLERFLSENYADENEEYCSEVDLIARELRELSRNWPIGYGELGRWPYRNSIAFKNHIEFEHWALDGWDPLFIFPGTFDFEAHGTASDDTCIYYKHNPSGYEYLGVGWRDYMR